MRNATTRLIGAFLVVIFGASLALDLKEFSLWGQITDLNGSNPFDLFAQAHPHALRYLLMLPALYVGDALGGRFDEVFTACVFLVMVATGVTMAHLANELLGRSRRQAFVHFAPLFAIMAAASLLMNGRISISMLGICVIALAQARWMLEKVESPWILAMQQALGLWLMSVSSGTFMVGLAMVFMFSLAMPVATYPSVKPRNVRVALIGVVLMVATVPIALLFIDKNVRFYGGGLTGLLALLDHGAGNLLLKISSTALVTLSLSAIPLTLMAGIFVVNSRIRLRRGSPVPPVQFGIVVSLCLGVFGFSTLLVCLPLVVTVAYVKLLKDGYGLRVRPGIAASEPAL